MNLDSIDEMDNTRMSALMVREGRVVSRLTSTVVHSVLRRLSSFYPYAATPVSTVQIMM